VLISLDIVSRGNVECPQYSPQQRTMRKLDIAEDWRGIRLERTEYISFL
jgi:hypothetical protein